MNALAAAEPFTIRAGRRELEREDELRRLAAGLGELVLDLRAGEPGRLERRRVSRATPEPGVIELAVAIVTWSAGVDPPRAFIAITRRGMRLAIFPIIPISVHLVCFR